jgi:hypothetical protein
MATDPATGGHPTEVTIRDRRELPFFQIRLAANRSIRDEVSGPRRLRTIGFYGLLCQLANEQRHTGEHRRIHFTYDTLAARAGIAKRNVKLMLSLLQQAGVVRYERLADPERGATISILHLLVHDGAWTAITVAMADRLAATRPGGHYLRELGLVIVLLEFCVFQREARHGLSAEISRAEIAQQAGLTTDRVDQCNRLLEAAGVLTITRRRPASGGRNLTSVYTIHEAPAPISQGRETEPPGPQTGTDRAAERNWRGRKLELAAPTTGTARAANGNSQSGISALQRDETRPSYARAGLGVEETPIEDPTNSNQSKGHGGGGGAEIGHQLCLSFLQAWAPVLGDSLAGAYEANRREWLAAAQRLLDRHTPERLQRGLEQMLVDEVVGSRALTLPAFEKVADQLIARRHARQHAPRGARESSTIGRPSWERAKQLLERAIQRYGRDQRDQALAELRAHDPRLVEFVERVRWSTLCEEPIRFVERRYAEVWSEITAEVDRQRKEPAA